MAQPTAAANLFTAEVFFIVSVFSIVSVVSIVSIVSVYFVPSVFFIPFVFSPPVFSSPLFPYALSTAWPSSSTCMAVRSPRFCSQASWFPTLAGRSPGFAPCHPGFRPWPGGPPGFAPRASWFPTLAERSGGRLPLRLPSAIFRKPPARSFGGRKDSEYLLIVSTSGYIYVRIVWLIPGGQAPVMPAGQTSVMPAGQTWRFFQIANTP